MRLNAGEHKRATSEHSESIYIARSDNVDYGHMRRAQRVCVRGDRNIVDVVAVTDPSTSVS